MESFVSSTANNHKRQKIDCADTVSDLDTIMPNGWTMHKPAFFLTKVGQEWSVDSEIRSKVVAVIQSLSNNSPTPDPLLTFALGDTIDHTPKVVDATTIYSTAFVLPCVSLPSDDFLVDIDKATYFLVMPP